MLFDGGCFVPWLFRGGGDVTPVDGGDVLAAMTDAELLWAIRRGDVTAAAARVSPEAGYFDRDDIIRAEAARRGIL